MNVYYVNTLAIYTRSFADSMHMCKMIANVTCAFQSVVVCFSLAGLLTESTARNVDLTQDILGHPSAYGDSIHGGTPIAGWLWKILKNDG